MKKTLYKYFFSLLLFYLSFGRIQAKEPDGVFIIVPGTWSAFAWWHHTESAFFRELEKQSAHYNKKVTTYTWQGRNSDKNRKHAAKGLVKLIQTYPEKMNVYLISHSHGTNVAILASQELARTKSSRKIDVLFSLGAPVNTDAYSPNMNTIKTFYNVFSLEDIVQPVFGMYQRTYPQHSRIANLRIFINEKEPTHYKIHSPILAKWLPSLIFKHIKNKNETFSSFDYEKPGIINIYNNSEPTYEIDTNRKELLEEDIVFNQALPKLFVRKKLQNKTTINHD